MNAQNKNRQGLLFGKVRLFFAVFKSPCQGTSVLTVTRISNNTEIISNNNKTSNNTVLNYFSSLFNSFTTSPVVLSLQFCATSVTTETFFCLVLHVHLRQALKLVGWMEEQQEVRQNGFGAKGCSSKAREGQNASRS